MSQMPPQTPPSEEDELIYSVPSTRDKGTGVVFQPIFIIAFALLGIGLGIAAGLFYTWTIDPVIEKNTRPDQLNQVAKQNYVVAIALDYGETGDIQRAYSLLAEVDPDKDAFQIAADTMCELTREGQVQSAADIVAMRQLIAVFQGQLGVEVKCDTSIYATAPPPTIITPTQTFTPSPTVQRPDTKTPTVTVVGATPTDLPSPTPRSTRREFEPVSHSPFCVAGKSGVIEIKVRDRSGIPLAGIEAAVTWSTDRGQQEETFFTGLKPDIDDGYADYQGVDGETYQAFLVDQSSFSNELPVEICDESTGTLRGWEVVFQPVRNN